MTIQERIQLLAAVVACFPEMGEFGNVGALQQLVDQEWEPGAMPPGSILHIVSANTAMAGMQSLVRGLLLGSENFFKIPSVGLPRFEEMVSRLPISLRSLVTVSSMLPDEWLTQVDAVIVFGSDETVELFRQRVGSDQIFAGYGNRWSGAVIESDADFSSIDPLIRDICLYEQKGCLSAQIVWIHESIDAAEYGRRLAAALAEYVEQNEVATLTLEEAASVAGWRSSAEWQVVASGGAVWLSAGEPVWGVLLQGPGEPPGLSCLHRHVVLRTFSGAPDLGNLAETVSTLGFWPEPESRSALTGVSRMCRVGEMQFPHPTWQQDGFPALGRLLSKKGAE